MGACCGGMKTGQKSLPEKKKPDASPKHGNDKSADKQSLVESSGGKDAGKTKEGCVIVSPTECAPSNGGAGGDKAPLLCLNDKLLQQSSEDLGQHGAHENHVTSDGNQAALSVEEAVATQLVHEALEAAISEATNPANHASATTDVETEVGGHLGDASHTGADISWSQVGSTCESAPEPELSCRVQQIAETSPGEIHIATPDVQAQEAAPTEFNVQSPEVQHHVESVTLPEHPANVIIPVQHLVAESPASPEQVHVEVPAAATEVAVDVPSQQSIEVEAPPAEPLHLHVADDVTASLAVTTQAAVEPEIVDTHVQSSAGVEPVSLEHVNETAPVIPVEQPIEHVQTTEIISVPQPTEHVQTTEIISVAQPVQHAEAPEAAAAISVELPVAHQQQPEVVLTTEPAVSSPRVDDIKTDDLIETAHHQQQETVAIDVTPVAAAAVERVDLAAAIPSEIPGENVSTEQGVECSTASVVEEIIPVVEQVGEEAKKDRDTWWSEGATEVDAPVLEQVVAQGHEQRQEWWNEGAVPAEGDAALSERPQENSPLEATQAVDGTTHDASFEMIPNDHLPPPPPLEFDERLNSPTEGVNPLTPEDLPPPPPSSTDAFHVNGVTESTASLSADGSATTPSAVEKLSALESPSHDEGSLPATDNNASIDGSIGTISHA